MTAAALALLGVALPAGGATPCGSVAMFGATNCLAWATILDPLTASLVGVAGAPPRPGPTAVMIALVGVFVVGAQLIFGGELSDWARRMVMLCLTVGLLWGSRVFLWGLFGMTAAVIP